MKPRPSINLLIHPLIYLSTHPSTCSLIQHPFICSLIYPSIYPSKCPSIRPSLHPSLHLSTHPSTYSLIHLSIRPPTCSSTIHPFTHLSVHPSICPLVHPSIHPSIPQIFTEHTSVLGMIYFSKKTPPETSNTELKSVSTDKQCTWGGAITGFLNCAISW